MIDKSSKSIGNQYIWVWNVSERYESVGKSDYLFRQKWKRNFNCALSYDDYVRWAGRTRNTAGDALTTTIPLGKRNGRQY